MTSCTNLWNNRPQVTIKSFKYQNIYVATRKTEGMGKRMLNLNKNHRNGSGEIMTLLYEREDMQHKKLRWLHLIF